MRAFIDTNIFLYAGGKAHPEREACQDYIEKVREDELDRQDVAGYLRQPESAAVGKTGERLAAEVWPREDW